MSKLLIGSVHATKKVWQDLSGKNEICPLYAKKVECDFVYGNARLNVCGCLTITPMFPELLQES